MIRLALRDARIYRAFREFLDSGKTEITTEQGNLLSFFADIEVLSKSANKALKNLSSLDSNSKGVVMESMRTVVNSYLKDEAERLIPLSQEVKRCFFDILEKEVETVFSVASIEDILNIFDDAQNEVLPHFKELLNQFLLSDPSLSEIIESNNKKSMKIALERSGKSSGGRGGEAEADSSEQETFGGAQVKSEDAKKEGGSEVGEEAASPSSNTPGAAAAAANILSPIADPASREYDGAKVLVVDDSFPMIKMVTHTLTKEGFLVDSARNGEIALEILKMRRFDAVIIDLQMPVMDGFEAVRQFRAHESSIAVAASLRVGSRFHEELVPYVESITSVKRKTTSLDLSEGGRQLIIGMSSDVGKETADKAREAGMDYFIEKPFNSKVNAFY